jgi:hypothetical protein
LLSRILIATRRGLQFTTSLKIWFPWAARCESNPRARGSELPCSAGLFLFAISQNQQSAPILNSQHSNGLASTGVMVAGQSRR